MQNKFYSVVASCLCPLFFSQILCPSYAMEVEEIEMKENENIPRYSFLSKEIKCQMLSAYSEDFEYINKLITKNNLIFCFESQDLNKENLFRFNFSYENLPGSIEKLKQIIEDNQICSFSHHIEVIEKFISTIVLKKIEQNKLIDKENFEKSSEDLREKSLKRDYLEFILMRAMAKRALDKNKKLNKYSKTAQLVGFSLMYALKHKLQINPDILYLAQSLRGLGNNLERNGKIMLSWKGDKNDEAWGNVMWNDHKILVLEDITNILLEDSQKNEPQLPLFDENLVKNFSDTKSFLCSDGGGSKGILPATLLDILFMELQKDCEIKNICQVFDFFAGTSTGALLVLGLTCPHEKMKDQPLHTTAQIRERYKNLPSQIFSGLGWDIKILYKTKYSHVPLERILQEMLPNHATINNVIKPVLVLSFNITTQKLVCHLTKEKVNEDELEKDDGSKLWEAGRKSTAAPTVFEGHVDHDGETHVDGGVLANNPTYIAYKQVIKRHPENPILCLSLGTGERDYTPFKKTKGMDAINNNVINPIFVREARRVERKMSKKLTGTGKSGQNYFRLNALLPFSVDLDTKDPLILAYLEDYGISISKGNEFRKLVEVYKHLFKAKKFREKK